jgi:outer membrane receptor protein involved in Fe transport
MMKITKFILVFSLLFCTSLLAQTFTLSGKITSGRDNLVGASVSLTPGNYGGMSDLQGNYKITGIPSGTYTVKASFVGYETKTTQLTINSNQKFDFDLISTTIQTKEVIIEVNRAKDRETPVAFSNIDSKQIEKIIHGQDAPLLVKNTPGVFTYSTDGVGNGEAQVFVRGFSQNYVQVLINGIPTNDPESNAVYWSNWGSVSSNAASIQIQRGAGSSLYGAGSFGGSFNIITEDAPANPYYGLNLSLGSPKNTMYGIRFNSGLLADKFAVALNIDRKIGEGSRMSGRYEGINYYLSFSYFPAENQSLKFVLHGAPQRHGYSWSNSVAYFEKYGYDANPAPFLPRSVVDLLPNNKTTNLPNYGLADNFRELVDDKFVNLSHNFYHKPQLELHYNYDFSNISSLRATFFYSIGRGAGSSMNSTGTMFGLLAGSTPGYDTLAISNFYGSGKHYYGALLGEDGYPTSLGWSDSVYLKNAFQRISYSLHRQVGLIANYSTKFRDMLDLNVGGEFRSWRADHPGHFTNLFGKTSITQNYACDTSTVPGVVKVATFSRRLYQGDIDGPTNDVGFPSGWNLNTADTWYRTQYRNYVGETPQFTLFAQGNWKYHKLNLMTSLQYVWYQYKLTENMPSENAVGKLLTSSQVTSLGLIDSSKEGPRGGMFYMRGTNGKWYEFALVNENRSRGFIQPKIGFNYNATENWNVFANFAHVERFVDLGVYYNQGRVNKNVEDEKSNQIEIGTGWASPWLFAKLNGFWMVWENKSASITDVTKAGTPGYDRNGRRSELVGTSRNVGIEIEFNTKLDEFLPFKGFGFRGSLTYMDNTWTKILDIALIDNTLGTLQEDKNLNGVLDAGEDTDADKKLDENRRVFFANGIDASGKKDAMYFAELKDKHVSSGPQTMFSLGLTYEYEGFFANLDMINYSRNYLLDGEGYLAVEGTWNTVNNKEVFKSTYDNQMPVATTFDFAMGYNFQYQWFKGYTSFQAINLFNTKYFIAADRNGLIPGALQSFRFNLGIGI